jgi:tagatose-1,6-bisphosphate aldolase
LRRSPLGIFRLLNNDTITSIDRSCTRRSFNGTIELHLNRRVEKTNRCACSSNRVHSNSLTWTKRSKAVDSALFQVLERIRIAADRNSTSSIRPRKTWMGFVKETMIRESKGTCT